MNNKLIGFTLAEVLITLGIIGVVAAMTLPSLIANYKRKVVVTQLKKTYSTLSQAFERSKADYGDSSNWDLGGNYLLSVNEVRKVTENFSKIYLIPYLSKVKEAKYTSWKDVGYTYIKISSDWTTEQNLNSPGQILILSDGTILQVSVVTSNYGTIEDRDDRIIAIMIYADVNGLKNPNELGKDIFAFRMSLTDGKFGFYTNSSGITYMNRAMTLQYCKISPITCGQLIMTDNWEMREDYPWLW